MKANMITLAAIFSLTMNVLFAGNFEPAVNNEMIVSYNMLAPLTPAEATFEELPAADFSVLAPSTPAEADFSDAPEITSNISFLAPVAPTEAGFSEEEPSGIISLIPVTPAAADFSDAM